MINNEEVSKKFNCVKNFGFMDKIETRVVFIGVLMTRLFGKKGNLFLLLFIEFYFHV